MTFHSGSRSITFGIGKALSISVLNQVVSSGTNFIIGFYLVRVLSLTQFGFYGVGIAVILLYVGAGNALFLTQMVVRIPDKQPEQRLQYAARMLVATSVFAVITLGITVGALIVCSIWFSLSGLYVHLIGAIAVASIGALLKEFFVRQAYSAREESRALKANITVSLIVVALLAFCHFYLNIYAAWQVLWIYGAGQIMGAIVGLFLAKLPCLPLSWEAVLSDAKEAFSGGRWALGGVTVIWAQSQAYTYVTALFLGVAGVGYANAARLLVAPLMFLMPALNQLTIPRLAELRKIDRCRMFNLGFYISIGLVTLAFIYTAVLLCFADKVASLLLGDKFQAYPNFVPLVAIWCLVMHFQIIRSGAVNLLQALKNFRVLTITNIYSAIVAVLGAIIMSNSIGVPGAILGTGLGELIFSVLLWKAVWYERKNTN